MRQIKWKTGLGLLFFGYYHNCTVTKCPISNFTMAASFTCAECKFNESTKNGIFSEDKDWYTPNPFTCSAPPLARELHG